MEAPIDHHDVTTVIGLLGDIKADVHRIRVLMEDEEDDEETGEPDG